MIHALTTPLTAAVLLALWALGPARGLWVLMATLPLGAAAAVSLPGLGSISPTEVALAALWPLVLLRPGAGPGLTDAALRPGGPGPALMALMAWAAMSALLVPRLMAGATEVFTLVRADTGAAILRRPLAPGPGNLGQLARLGLGAAGFLALAAALAPETGAGAARLVWRGLAVATGLQALLAGADLLVPALLEPLRSADLGMRAGQQLLGLTRLAGGFSEPAAFAYVTIGLYGAWLAAALARVPWAVLGLAVSAALLLRSAASSAYAGMALTSAAVLLWQLGPMLRRGAGIRLYAGIFALLPALVAGAVMLLAGLPALAALADSLLWSKLDSASGVERMAWSAQALRNAAETWGLGAGLGSLRASGWAASVLGSLGLPGAALFAWFLWQALRPRGGGAAASALRTGACAMLLQAQLTRPHPDLGPAFFVFAGVAAGLSRGALRRGRLAHG